VPVKNSENGANVKFPILFLWAVCIVVLTLKTIKTDRGFWYKIEMEKDVIKLKFIGKVLQFYRKKEVFIKYCVYITEDKKVFPCVFISNINKKNDTIYFKNITLEGDGNFFLVPLNEKRLRTIATWYDRKIELPYYNDIVFSDEYKGETIKKFYKFIEANNFVESKKT